MRRDVWELSKTQYIRPESEEANEFMNEMCHAVQSMLPEGTGFGLMLVIPMPGSEQVKEILLWGSNRSRPEMAMHVGHWLASQQKKEAKPE